MTTVEEPERRDALARILDPDSWGLYDDPRMKDEAIREAVVKSSRETAQEVIESGLLASVKWDRREYYQARDRIIECTSRTGRCYSVEDGLDGYFKHDPKCPLWPQGAVGSSKGCIK